MGSHRKATSPVDPTSSMVTTLRMTSTGTSCCDWTGARVWLLSTQQPYGRHWVMSSTAVVSGQQPRSAVVWRTAWMSCLENSLDEQLSGEQPG